jgi:hypothetical protein
MDIDPRARSVTDMTSEETPHDKFRRLAESRVNRALNDIRLIGNLSNKNNYDYSSEEIDKIFRALDSELKQVRARFLEGARRDSEFRL